MRDRALRWRLFWAAAPLLATIVVTLGTALPAWAAGDDADVRAARGIRSQRRGRDRHLGARPASHRPGPPAGGGGGRRARRKQLRRRLLVLDDPDAGNRAAPGHSSPPRCRGTARSPGDRRRRVRGPVGGLRPRAYRICV